MVAELVNTLTTATPIEVWFQDEMRIGQKNGLVYQWAKKGSRPRQPKDQRYENAYLFGAVCPGRNIGIAVIMPHADTDAMQKHVDEISLAVAPGAHALIILDKAAWHTTRKLKLPENLTLVPLPPACPELNAAETSGSTCARPISQIACSKPTPQSSTRVRTHGVAFSTSSAAPRPLPAATGPPQVNQSEVWYYFLI